MPRYTVADKVTVDEDLGTVSPLDAVSRSLKLFMTLTCKI